MDIDNIKNKILLLLLILLCMCSCTNKEKNLPNREKYDVSKDTEVKKENLYGCWKLNNRAAFKDETLIYEIATEGKMIFNEDVMEFCTFIDEKYDCTKFNYTLEKNYINFNPISGDDEFATDKFNVNIKEITEPLLELYYYYQGNDNYLHLTYGCDEKDS